MTNATKNTTQPTATADFDRESYQAKVQAQLQKIDARIDEAKAKSQQLEADTKLSYENAIEELQVQRDAVEQKLKELQSSTDEAWATLQAGFESAWNELVSSFEKAGQSFQKPQ